MKIQIASDLHLDLLQQRFPGYRVIEPADADVLVIAGDIHAGIAALDVFADWPVPVVYVNGNHEAYGHEYASVVEDLRQRSAGSGVHYLEREQWVLGGVRFVGCCLWTDYLVTGDDRETAMAQSGRMLNDHRLIRNGAGLFSPADALRLHQLSRAWLETVLATPFDGPTVVVSHHAPHPASIHPRFAGSSINAAFASDLTALMGKAQVWIHGHVHDSFDYEIGGTRVIANPRGYARNRHAADTPTQVDWENLLFQPALVIEV